MIQLTEAIKNDVANAFMSAHPMIVIGVTADGEPTVSFRGTVQPFGADALAFWSRKPSESTLVASLAIHDTVVLVYSNMPDHCHYQFKGKGRLVDDADVNRAVWENSPEIERQRDPDRLGSAVVVDLISVRGRNGDGPVMMEA